MSQGDVEARVVADTSGLQAGMVQAAVVTEAQMKKIAQYVRAANDSTASLGKTAASAAASTSSAYKQIADGAEKVRAGHAGVNRELLVLTHELSQGNFSRFGGSMLVLAERTNALEYAMTVAGAATLGLAAAGVGFVAMAAMGAIEADKFSKSLQLTGNYAAVTASQIKVMADAQAKQTGQTPGGARTSLEAVAGSGIFGASTLAAASRALGDYQKLTSETAAEALKNFARIQDGVAKWAEEENKSVHFLTSADYERIKAMEDSGDKQGAATAALTAYAQAIESRAVPSLGILARAWREVTESADQFKQAMMDVGRPSVLADQISAVQRQIQWDKSGNAGGSYADRMRDMAEQQAKLAKLMQQSQAEAAAVAGKAQAAAQHEAAIEADKYVDGVLKGAKALSARTAELKKWDAAVAARAADHNPMQPADIAAGRAEIMKRYQEHGTGSQANEYQSLTARIKAFNETTDAEIDGAKKLSEGQRLVIDVQERLATSAKHLTTSQKDAARTDAARAGALRDLADASVAAEKSMMEDADRAIKQSTAAMQTQQKAMDTFQRSGQKQVSDIDFQTSLMGKSPEDAARMQAAHSRELAANQALEASSGRQLNEILAEQARQRDDVNAALDRQIAKQKQLSTLSAGWSAALDDFAKKAADDATTGRKVFEDMANGMTDAITQAAMTGKFSIKSMVDSIIQDLIRMEAQKGVAALFGSGGASELAPGFLGKIGSLFGGSAGGGAASGGDYSSAGLAAAFGYANGLDYVPYDGFPAILHEGERVIPRQDAAVARNAAGGHTINISSTNSYGAGVDVATVAQMTRASEARTKADVQRALSTNGRF